MQNERFHFRCEHSPSFGPSLFCRCLFVSVSSCLQHYWVYNLFSQNTVTINYGRSDYLKRVWRNDDFHQEYTNYGKYQLSNNNSLTLVHEMLVALHYRNFRLRCHQDNKKKTTSEIGSTAWWITYSGGIRCKVILILRIMIEIEWKIGRPSRYIKHTREIKIGTVSRSENSQRKKRIQCLIRHAKEAVLPSYIVATVYFKLAYLIICICYAICK